MSQITTERPESDVYDEQYEEHANPEEAQEFEEELGNRFLFFQVMPSWMVSFIVHVVLIILLALLTFRLPQKEIFSLEAGEPTDQTESLEQMAMDPIDFTDPFENSEVEETVETEVVEEFEDVAVEDFAEEAFTLDDNLMESITGAEAVVEPSGGGDSMTGSRTGTTKSAMLKKWGGTAGSENAVKMALEWIAKHQLENGSWSFDHRQGPNPRVRTSPNIGAYSSSRFGATSMALLPFLGAGQTHLEGEYKEVVQKGVDFLIDNGVTRGDATSYHERQGNMYSHALATLVLTELYAMTRDTSLAEPAQKALNYIIICQDPVGGGWRYNPRDPGDTSVTGWQIMALKSGHMAGLEVPSEAIRGSSKFLDSVSAESNVHYGYLRPITPGRRRPPLTAVGLLCRMYLGWTQDNPSLQTGVAYLSRIRPQIGDWQDGDNVAENRKTNFRCDMYYNYYATQVMRHNGGDLWPKWNEEMRDFLIATQAHKGNARGSWYFSNPDDLGTQTGGRLYCTSMAAMTLEVYYRYMPLYDTKKTESAEFELD